MSVSTFADAAAQEIAGIVADADATVEEKVAALWLLEAALWLLEEQVQDIEHPPKPLEKRYPIYCPDCDTEEFGEGSGMGCNPHGPCGCECHEERPRGEGVVWGSFR